MSLLESAIILLVVLLCSIVSFTRGRTEGVRNTIDYMLTVGVIDVEIKDGKIVSLRARK